VSNETVIRESGADAFDATEPGSCNETTCPRPRGPHGWCRAHSCGDEVPDTNTLCRLQAGHGGHWHDSGSQCWLMEATFTGPDPGPDRRLLIDTIRYVLGGGLAQTSAVQRNVRVGFAKAGHLLTLMEDWGLVAPREGSMARRVLAPAERLDEILDAIDAKANETARA